MPSPLMYGLLALAVLGALGGIYGAGYRSGSNAVHDEWNLANLRARKAESRQYQAAAEKKETGDAKARVVYRTITREVERVVKSPDFDRECLNPDGLRIARDAIRGEVSDPAKPDQPLRPPARTSRRESGVHLAMDYGRF